MGMSIQLDEVLRTQDGPWECYDATVAAAEILTMYQTGFLKLDPDAQRGKDLVTDKLVLDLKKVERWTEELIAGTAILGQLSWNFRTEETELTYDMDQRSLKVSAGAATIPDSFHRCLAIVRAAESHKKGSDFDTKRKFSVRIYHVSKEEEKRIFYAMNQEGKPADAGRSKWLHPKEPTQRLAAELVRTTPGLGDNIDTVRDRLSKRNWRLAAFGTISKAIEDAWAGVPLSRPELFDENLGWLKSFWREAVRVLPELGKLDYEARESVRKQSLVDSANSIYALFQVARRMKDKSYPVETLKRLAEPVNVDGGTVPFLARSNPLWLEVGVLVVGEGTTDDGKPTVVLRNSRQARNAFVDAMLRKVGLGQAAEAA